MTAARKTWGIHGGVHPPENKSQSTGEPIGSIELAAEIVLPLSQHIGAPAIPVVEVGERVLKGQLLAQAQGLVSAPVHASTSGKVIAIEHHPVPHASGMPAPCLVLETDGRDEWTELFPCEDYTQLSNESILEKIRNAGISGMGGAGFPAAVKLNPRADQKIDTLILNGTECEPYITADDMLMRERADGIIAGAQLLAHLLNKPENVLIGIEDNKPEAIAAMRKAAEGTSIEIVVFPTKYPSGGEKQLIEIVTGKQVPSGGIPAQIGIVVQNVGSAYAAWRAVRFGEPLISRVTTLVGDSLSRQRNIEVPLGTPIVHMLKAHGWHSDKCARLIVGGPMMGFTIDNALAPVIKTTNCILAPSNQEMPPQAPAQACIRCGMCAEACPAELLPQQLYWFSRSEEFDKLREHNLFDCIECGACAYVCPSNIPLVQYYRASKGEIRRLDLEKEKSDKSRLRFEARKERLAKAEAEKEAKRVARKKAAEQAKKANAEKQAAADKTPGTNAAQPDIVAQAVAAAQTPAVDPLKEKAKLERALSSAQSRTERATKQLQEAEQQGEQEARLEALRARLKQAEQKVTDARQKLEKFNAAQQQVENKAEGIQQKMQSSPVEQLQKTIAMLEKRIATAKQKHQQAVQENSPTANALQLGVEKLQQKLETNQQELQLMQQQPPTPVSETDAKSVNAAQAAIDRAKAKAAAMASMSDEEKKLSQLKSLEARLAKAKIRLQKATEENDENLEAFQAGVEKLQQKLQQLQAGN